MGPTVCYHCPCSSTSTSTSNPTSNPNPNPTSAPSSASNHHSASALNLPPLPSYSPSSRYHFHPLTCLYFCEECDEIKCKNCITNEVSCYFCPNCLFEVPGASVKGEKSRCARNCFTCPICTNTLIVVASDPTNKSESEGQQPSSLNHPSSSIGESPYFLLCCACKWDSKSVGISFEKPTGLSMQLQKMEDQSAEAIEFESLKDHFESYLKVQSKAAPQTSMTSSASKENNLPSTKSSKLLRDLPSLSGSKYLPPSKSNLGGKAGMNQMEEIKEYQPKMSWENSRREENGMGIIGRREENRREMIRNLKNEERVSSLEMRWENPWEMPIRVSDLKPQRVPLKTRQTRRCSNCRHILIKPDMKPNSSNKQFRIKSLASSFLPLIEVSLSKTQPSLRGGSTFEDRERNRLSKRQSTLLGGGTLGKRSSLTGSGFMDRDSSFGDEEVNLEYLRKGKNYKFEIDFENPLDDVMIIRLSVAKHRISSQDSSDPINDAGLERHQERPESAEKKSDLNESHPSKESKWSVNLSTSNFMIQPYNEMLDLEEDLEEDDINLNLNSSKSNPRSSLGVKDGLLDSIQDDVEDSLDQGRNLEGKGDDVIGSRISARERNKTSGILRRKGHTTTIGLDLSIGKEAGGEIEFGLFVSYTFQSVEEIDNSTISNPISPPGSRFRGNSAEERELEMEREREKEESEREREKDNNAFSFWTAVRLGRVAS